ncbi:L,D-transpeptidase [Ruegeria sp. HKCCD4315]|nr:L,D-transpeptidase family protein [Ruegeria sp. HKCCD7296]NOD46115.1 L,D-transpeptidase family protein [Ruegeria sp. HKCCD5849]NOD50585.1 L,D-transpeptidase family protein [Ruegeria sp. HKCCD5851]NOD63459.1 L,D-transpeptidase family protein [Ruegeria sp. HKCCD6109]NOD67401.1 L,D-transpeptidase family protein [Ruegeria sp. HKCCD7303]NOD75287.1 L,D-transpeptidase family protein [Ruegeria sp. HKCCD4332]NOD87248.1 L,D-transpeptidase family protein [Ruegeria sp. HKCCD4318]NOD91359.1 L,D-transp
MSHSRMTRRSALLGAASLVATPALVRAQSTDAFPETEDAISTQLPVRRNVSSFSQQNWQDHFDELGVGCLLADITSRAVHYWSPDGTYKLYPSSVPMSEELTKRGYTKVVRKTEFPSWTPTASMRERDPSLPVRMEGGDPGNPLGTRAMYLGWPAYLVHGTHDTRKIGRQSSSGCIGLYNQHVEELYPLVQIGTQVRLV